MPFIVLCLKTALLVLGTLRTEMKENNKQIFMRESLTNLGLFQISITSIDQEYYPGPVNERTGRWECSVQLA